MNTRRATIVLSLIFNLSLWAQFDFPPAPVSAAPEVKAELLAASRAIAPGKVLTVAVRLKMATGWHVYGQHPSAAGSAPQITWTLPPGFTAGAIRWPPVSRFETPLGPNLPPLVSYGYENEVLLIQEIETPTKLGTGQTVTLNAKITWVACKTLCVPDEAVLSLTLPLEKMARPHPENARLIAAWQAKIPAKRPATGKVAPVQLWKIIVLGLVFGLIMNLMPCVWPVLSIKIVHFIEQAGEGRKAWRHGLAFALGVLASFWILAGVLEGLRRAGKAAGWGFQLSSPVFVICLIFLLFLMGLNFFGVFEFGLSLAGVGQGATRKTGLAGSFFSGMLATVIATPCTGPFMGVYIGYALATPQPGIRWLFFTLLGVGMGLPYLLLTSFPGLLRKVPRPGRWMETLKQFMGFILMATVVYLVYVVISQLGDGGTAFLLLGLVIAGIAAWVYGRWATPASPARMRNLARVGALLLLAGGVFTALWAKEAVKSRVQWQVYSEARLVAERQAGRAVFINFSAKWCTVCKFNKLAFTRKVAAKFTEKKVIPLEADWTDNDPLISAKLAELGRSSVPFYVLYYPELDKEPIILPELLTPDILLKALDKLESPH